MTHTKIWTDMFVLSLPLAEKIIRPILVYLFLVAGLRLAGKRELAQLNPFDLVVLLMLSNTVQNAIIGDDNTVVGGVVGAATLLTINYLVVRFLFRHPDVDQALEGQATCLVRDGKVLHDQLKKETIPVAELDAAARRQGFDGLQTVQEALLEPGGIITFTAKQPDPDHIRHRELLDRIEQLSRQIAELRPAQSTPGATT